MFILNYFPVVDITFETKWTPDGFSVTPNVQNFDDINKVKITYEFINDENTRDDDDPTETVNETEDTPLQSTNPYSLTIKYSRRPHILKDFQRGWEGILTATASDGRYTATRQDVIQGMLPIFTVHDYEQHQIYIDMYSGINGGYFGLFIMLASTWNIDEPLYLFFSVNYPF